MAAAPPRYLDAAATALAPAAVGEAMADWLNRGHPAAAYAGAEQGRELLRRLRGRVLGALGLPLDDYEVFFTRGAAESNAFLLAETVRRYAVVTGRLPHLVLGGGAHLSALDAARRLAADRACALTEVPVDSAAPPGPPAAGGAPPAEPGPPAEEEPRPGAPGPGAIQWAIRRPGSCLVSVSAAAHETGARPDLEGILAVTRAWRPAVPLHVDAAQVFARAPLPPGVAAVSGSFHKIGGPPGVGFLALSRLFLDAFGLGDPGAHGLPNLPGLGGAEAALCRAAARGERGARLVARLRLAVQEALAKHFPCFPLEEAALASGPAGAKEPGCPCLACAGAGAGAGAAGTKGAGAGAGAGAGGAGAAAAGARPCGAAAARALRRGARGGPPPVAWGGPAAPGAQAPHILLIAVAHDLGPEGARRALERRGVIVAAGSAAAAAALGLPAPPWGTLLRVSFSADSTAADAAEFVRAFVEVFSARR